MNNENNCPCKDVERTTQTTKSTQTSSSFATPNNQHSINNNQQMNFASITNFMSLLQQLPVFPQAPGYAASYAPDKIPKGAVVAFMPVIILPPEAYLNCNNENESGNEKHTSNDNYQNVDPFPLGVQPAAIPASFSLNSLFSGGFRKDQCMCPCSCTQNIPDRVHKKRDTDSDVQAVKTDIKSDIESEPKIATDLKPMATETKGTTVTVKDDKQVEQSASTIDETKAKISPTVDGEEKAA